MEIRLREAGKADFEALWRIDQECFTPGISYSRMELAYYMRRTGAFTVVAESVHRPVRSASAHPNSAEIVGFVVAEAGRRKVGHVITIDVLTGARRAGVGSRLLAAAEGRLQEAGCGSVYLETAVDNGAALSFYKRHGYFLVKTMPRYYANGVDAFVLQKDLVRPETSINAEL